MSQHPVTLTQNNIAPCIEENSYNLHPNNDFEFLGK